MIGSSAVLLIACLLTGFLSSTEPGNPNYYVFIPLILLGISYSFYGPIQDSTVPYIVPANMLGTAFGINAVLYNVGMFVSPLIAGQTLETGKKNGYFWTMFYFSALQVICTILNVWVYFDDLKNRGGALSKVDKSGDD